MWHFLRGLIFHNNSNKMKKSPWKVWTPAWTQSKAEEGNEWLYVFSQLRLNPLHVKREGKTWEDTAQEKWLLDKMTQTHSTNATTKRRWNKNSTLWKIYYIQHRTVGRQIVLMNNDLLFMCLIRNDFSSDWEFIYPWLQGGDNYKELEDFIFSKNNSTLAENLFSIKFI